ncbi:MAG: hypothetical protein C0624_03495 [Desulfuromonas sp.]|nr:MAG: hypothetical protein C0624_03495 [Desulfuromonas sp.]
MKIKRIVILAMLIAFASVAVASAGTQVYKNEVATVAAKIENNSGRSVPAAVKMSAYDDAGNLIGHLCREAYLSSYRDNNIEFSWQAPAYATGVYWSTQVEKYGSCGTTDETDYHEHTDDYEEHDDEHDDDDYAEEDHYEHDYHD